VLGEMRVKKMSATTSSNLEFPFNSFERADRIYGFHEDAQQIVGCFARFVTSNKK
jgi:hypothetical protein